MFPEHGQGSLHGTEPGIALNTTGFDKKIKKFVDIPTYISTYNLYFPGNKS